MLPYDYKHILEMFIAKEIFFLQDALQVTQRNYTKLSTEFLLGSCHVCCKQQKSSNAEVWQNICSFIK